MTSRKNFRSHKKARQQKAMEQVKARIKANGKAANNNEKERKGMTPDMERKRLERAKEELKILKQRV